MVTLLKRTREINRLLQKTMTVECDDMTTVLGGIIKANVYIVSLKGRVLSKFVQDGFKYDVMTMMLQQKELSERYAEWLLEVNETRPNIRLDNYHYCRNDNLGVAFCNEFTMIVPIFGNGQRTGTLIATRCSQEFADDDVIVAEYGATVTGIKLAWEHTAYLTEMARKKTIAQITLGTLSYSAAKALGIFFEELQGSEGLIVASKLADRHGIAQSVISNALRKLESAGVIKTKSLGMKGTYIKVTNECLLEELRAM